MNATLFAQAMNHCADGITLADVTQHDFPLVYVNESFCKLTGYERDEVIGKNCRFLQGKETDRITVKCLGDAIRSGNACQVEFVNYRKDGSTFMNQLTLAPIYADDGTPHYYAGIQRDVTALRTAEIGSHRLQFMVKEYKHDLNRIIAMLTQNVEVEIRALRRQINQGDVLPSEMLSRLDDMQKATSLMATILHTRSDEILDYIEYDAPVKVTS